MRRLSSMPARLAALPPRIARQHDAEGHSPTAEPLRRLYSTTRWRKLRLEIFDRDGFTCQRLACRRLIGDTAQLACDHIIPHRGDEALFWDRANLQTLCKPCHDRHKQALDHRRPT